MEKKKKYGWFLFIAYSAVLVWIILFKFSLSLSDITAMLNNQVTSLNLIPFKGSVIVNGKIYFNEIINNVVIFIPLGGILGMIAKRPSFTLKLMFVLGFSLLLETCQYVFGLGAADITDVLANVSGGLIGLIIYDFLELIFPKGKLDKFLSFIGSLLLVAGTAFIVYLLVIN